MFSNEKEKNIKGFTLIEMLIAISIFALTILIATNVYLLISNTQRRVLAEQRIMDDVRALFETMSQEIRLGRINYDFYLQNNCDLHPNGGNCSDVLAVYNQLNELIFFRKNGNIIQHCQELATGDCDLTSGTAWQDVTPEDVSIEDLQFFITPSTDPFTEVVSLSCADDSDCTSSQTYLSYRCDVGGDDRCEYYHDGGNFQPKVRIVIHSKGAGKRLIQQSQVTMQTTISTRVISGSVQNENY